MNIYPVTQNNFSSALNLLRKNKLPTEDIKDTTRLFVTHENNNVTAVIGLELYGTEALLRSLCVAEAGRKKGLGEKLVSFTEDYAVQKGIKTLYLLTTTAESFFLKRNYQKINRSEVPDSIQQTTEFTTVCAASATVMKKQL